MKSTTSWDADDIELVNQETTNNEPSAGASPNKIQILKKLAFRLLREVQSISEVQTLDIEEGLDFYRVVSRFEIDLITRALMHTGGHQGRAARLLNLKVTTLNSKIKHYQIRLDGFAGGYPFLGATEESHQHV